MCLFELCEVVRVRTTESVDTLPVVTDTEEVGATGTAERLDGLEFPIGDVLEFVDEDVLILGLVQFLRTINECRCGIDEVGKIGGIVWIVDDIVVGFEDGGTEQTER